MASRVEFYRHDIDVADSFAQKAFNRMRLDEIPPVPQNFEVWYVYYANVNPKLRDDINKILLEQDKVTESDCQDLYEKYINYGHDRETFEKAGDQIMNTLSDVSDLMQNVQGTTNDFTGTLKDTTTKLAASQKPEDIKSLIGLITDETEKMIQYNKELEGRLNHSSEVMGDLKKDMERIRREAVTDGLTGLANRKAFDEQIARSCREAKRDKKEFSLIIIDIDHFKAFNDKYGHQIGDQVLRLVALTLVDEVKGQDMAARYGGEEFCIILPGTSKQEAKFVAENLRKAVERKEVINRSTGDNLGQITISLGVAEYLNEDTPEDLIRRADRALYKSKDDGRNRVTVASVPTEIPSEKSAI
ncbi:MAG: GGDEF domain-containing protein [Pseudomonadota bacterium]